MKQTVKKEKEETEVGNFDSGSGIITCPKCGFIFLPKEKICPNPGCGWMNPYYKAVEEESSKDKTVEGKDETTISADYGKGSGSKEKGQKEDGEKTTIQEPTALPRRCRNWFVTLALVGGAILSFLLFVLFSIGVYFEERESNYYMFVAIVQSCILAGSLGLFMLSRYYRKGFYLFSLALFISGISLCFTRKISRGIDIVDTLSQPEGWVLASVVLVGVVLLWLILKIRRNGYSAWSLSDRTFSEAKLGIPTIIYIIIAIIPLIMPSELKLNSYLEWKNYNGMVDSCVVKMDRGSASNPQYLVEAKQLYKSILKYEAMYKAANGSYCRSAEIDSLLDRKTNAAAKSWADAADAQAKVHNEKKAVEFYSTSLALMENEQVRDKFVSKARKYGFIKRADVEILASYSDKIKGAINEKMPLDSVRYIYPNLVYDSWDATKEHNVNFKIKIYNNGNLVYNSKKSKSYSFLETHIIEPGNGNTLCFSGWGNDKGNVYKSGSVKVEIWSEGLCIASDEIVVKYN